jgi:hypothetical protein
MVYEFLYFGEGSFVVHLGIDCRDHNVSLGPLRVRGMSTYAFNQDNGNLVNQLQFYPIGIVYVEDHPVVTQKNGIAPLCRPGHSN